MRYHDPEEKNITLIDKQYRHILTAFKKIYTALRDGDNRLFKENFLLKIEGKSVREAIIRAITVNCRVEPHARVAKAWRLTEQHLNDFSAADNLDLFYQDYQWSFANMLSEGASLCHSGLDPESSVSSDRKSQETLKK